MKARMWTERRKNYSEQLFSTAVVFPLAILQKKILTNTHTHTYTHKISYYPNPCCTLGLCMCFLRVCVCMCVGSAVPPGCPETNWQFEKLWLQGKASKARDGDKEERESRREREIESGGKKGTRHNNIHKGRAGSAKCGQQSLYLCDADSPLFMPTFQGRNQGEGEKVFTLTQTWHLSLQSFSLFFGSCPLPRSTFFPLNNTLEWRTILLLTPLLPPSNSIQGSCEQGLEPLLTALSSLFSFFSATISPSRPLFF